eukprot:3754891-Prymnesium_polylepis.1
MWAPGQRRQFMLNDGKVLKCRMTPNHLAWLKLKPIMDSDRLTWSRCAHTSNPRVARATHASSAISLL